MAKNFQDWLVIDEIYRQRGGMIGSGTDLGGHKGGN
jgi:hypothetical protein